jgi:hypothetical protein
MAVAFYRLHPFIDKTLHLKGGINSPNARVGDD